MLCLMLNDLQTSGMTENLNMLIAYNPTQFLGDALASGKTQPNAALCNIWSASSVDVHVQPARRDGRLYTIQHCIVYRTHVQPARRSDGQRSPVYCTMFTIHCIVHSTHVQPAGEEGWSPVGILTWTLLCSPSHSLLNTGHTTTHHPLHHHPLHHHPLHHHHLHHPYHQPKLHLRPQNLVRNFHKIPLKYSCNFYNRLFILS